MKKNYCLCRLPKFTYFNTVANLLCHLFSFSRFSGWGELQSSLTSQFLWREIETLDHLLDSFWNKALFSELRCAIVKHRRYIHTQTHTPQPLLVKLASSFLRQKEVSICLRSASNLFLSELRDLGKKQNSFRQEK